MLLCAGVERNTASILLLSSFVLDPREYVETTHDVAVARSSLHLSTIGMI